MADGVSKAANVLFTVELQRRIEAAGYRQRHANPQLRESVCAPEALPTRARHQASIHRHGPTHPSKVTL